jgi:transcriptional regulator
VYLPPADRARDDQEWRTFVAAQRFGHLIACDPNRDWLAMSASQFVLDGDEVLLHFAGPNPVVPALTADPRAVLAVAGDWAFVPSDWKAINGEDPKLGIPTTYYAAVQLRGRAEVRSSPADVAAVLRRQLAALQPGVDVADPEDAHPAKLKSIRAVVLHIEEVAAKFKFGGNVDTEHRLAVVDRMRARGGPGDDLAVAHTLRRLERERH